MIKLNGCNFWLKMMTYWRDIILFEIKSALILKKNFIANLPITKFLLKTKINSSRDEATDLHDKEIPKRWLGLLLMT